MHPHSLATFDLGSVSHSCVSNSCLWSHNSNMGWSIQHPSLWTFSSALPPFHVSHPLLYHTLHLVITRNRTTSQFPHQTSKLGTTISELSSSVAQVLSLQQSFDLIQTSNPLTLLTIFFFHFLSTIIIKTSLQILSALSSSLSMALTHSPKCTQLPSCLYLYLISKIFLEKKKHHLLINFTLNLYPQFSNSYSI